MDIQRYYINIFLLGILLIAGSCQEAREATISGTIDYIGSSELYIEKKPVHYKYAEKIRFPIDPDNRGRFQQSIPLDSQSVVFFTIDEIQYPVVGTPGQEVILSIEREHFPDSVAVDGYEEPWHRNYANYLAEEKRFRQKIDEELPAFRNGESQELLNLFKHRYKLAKRHLAETPLEIYYYKNIGRYLVKRLENIQYNYHEEGFEPNSEREEVVEEAKQLNFFSFKSLKAQRAGIRDFTHAYANSFGIQDSLEQVYGQELMEYDVKRLGYEKMDSARVSVLDHIEDRKALAYARMHLIAERLGEMPLEVAEPSYRNFMEEFSDYPRYTNFLREFYSRIERVRPGNPAIPFTLPNQYEQPVSMEDFRGKYVLLDFWASWCIPCLDEFQDMRELYGTYSRDQFEIVAISIEEDSLRWRQSLQQFQNPWHQLYGGNGFQQETFSAYQGGGIPFYILVDPEGNIERYNDIRPSFNLPALLDSLITE